MATRGKAEGSVKRTLHTDFYLGKKLVKVNRSSRVANAVPNAVRRLQWGGYGADRVEVYGTEGDATGEGAGKLYAVIRAHLNGAAKPQLSVMYLAKGVRAIKAESKETK